MKIKCSGGLNMIRDAAISEGFKVRETGRARGHYVTVRVFPTSDDRRKWSLHFHTRRVNAVCWHGHRDFLRALFALDPDAVVITAVARYRGANHFEGIYRDTWSHNVGSRMCPIPYGSSCMCDWRDV